MITIKNVVTVNNITVFFTRSLSSKFLLQFFKSFSISTYLGKGDAGFRYFQSNVTPEDGLPI